MSPDCFSRVFSPEGIDPTSLDEAIEMAAEALALHVEGMLAEAEAIPEPSSVEQLQATHPDGSLVVVPLQERRPGAAGPTIN